MFDTGMNHFQSVFAHKFFVAPADQNYLLARFCRTHSLDSEFWWQALQAVEKLLKAGLVLNGVSVKRGFSHDIERLWHKHNQVFGDLSLQHLDKPDGLDQRFWSVQPLEHFVSRINQMGQPDCRYGLVSHRNATDDLFKLDQFVFQLRRRTIGLNWVVGKDWEDKECADLIGRTYSDVLRLKPEHQVRKLDLPKASLEAMGSDFLGVLHSWNFSFMRDKEDIEKRAPRTVAPLFAGFGNSYLYLLWEELKRVPVTDQGRNMVNWLLSNVQVGSEAEREFKTLLAA